MNKFLFNFFYRIALKFYKPEWNFVAIDELKSTRISGVPVITSFGSVVNKIKNTGALNNTFYFDKANRVGRFLKKDSEFVELIVVTPRQILEMDALIPFDYTNCSEAFKNSLEEYRKILLEERNQTLTNKQFLAILSKEIHFSGESEFENKIWNDKKKEKDYEGCEIGDEEIEEFEEDQYAL